MDVCEDNVVYLKSNINPILQKVDQAQTITKKAETQITDLTDEVQSNTSPVIRIVNYHILFSHLNTF